MKTTALKVLNAETASINTVSVNVSALMVSNRQVTLALFRQLIVEDILTADLTLAGVPWGHVNYLLEDWKNARHIVWQKGEELRRSIVLREDREYYETGLAQESDIRLEHVGDGAYRYRLEGFQINKESDWRTDRPLEVDDKNKLARIALLERVNAARAVKNRERRDRKTRYDAVVAPLFDLPQLFIAV